MSVVVMILNNFSFMAKDRCQQQQQQRLGPIQLLYTTTGLCFRRAARSQWWRPKNKTSVSALLPWWWDGPGLCVGSLWVNTVLRWNTLELSFGLASSLRLEPGLHIYSWSLAVSWKSKQQSDWLNKQPSQNQTVTPSSSSRSTAALSRHFITLCAEWASFMSAGFMTLCSQTRGPDTDLHQRLSQIPLSPLLCCGQTGLP